MGGPLSLNYIAYDGRYRVIFIKNKIQNRNNPKIAIPIVLKDKFYHEGMIMLSFKM
jgi:hypothetical protein